ncbi:hypothetical protein [Moorena sp. SIO4G3]|uniref:hypothetical protein n=1 Tax=Moorena sp. SIO4G3 TaxID=2607821 RepID=UPI001429C8A1|nr:hypothetical protein [Moorena sp. SIO4G3]NEO77102.1 hypothetical protein [Moorena sp. SIO4G3]
MTYPVINNYTDTVLEKLTTNTRVALRCSVRAATGLTFGHATRSHLTNRTKYSSRSQG